MTNIGRIQDMAESLLTSGYLLVSDMSYMHCFYYIIKSSLLRLRLDVLNYLEDFSINSLTVYYVLFAYPHSEQQLRRCCTSIRQEFNNSLTIFTCYFH